MATNRARKPKNQYHPAPKLREALTFFKSIGMKKGDAVNLNDGYAQFWKGDFRAIHPVDTSVDCTCDGLTLLDVVSALTEQTAFHFTGAELEIKSDSQSATLEASGSTPIVKPAGDDNRPFQIETWLQAAQLALDCGAPFVDLADGFLKVVGTGISTDFYLGLQLPFVLRFAPENIKAFKKAKAAAVVSVLPGNAVGFWFLNGAAMTFGEIGQSSETSLFDYWPTFLDERLPVDFWAALRVADKLSTSGEITFFADYFSTQIANGKIMISKCARGPAVTLTFKIYQLLAIQPLADRCEWGEASNIPVLWFHNSNARGAVAAVTAGNVDG